MPRWVRETCCADVAAGYGMEKVTHTMQTRHPCGKFIREKGGKEEKGEGKNGERERNQRCTPHGNREKGRRSFFLKCVLCKMTSGHWVGQGIICLLVRIPSSGS